MARLIWSPWSFCPACPAVPESGAGSFGGGMAIAPAVTAASHNPGAVHAGQAFPFRLSRPGQAKG